MVRINLLSMEEAVGQLYTFIMEFGGGTYIKQIEANSLKESLEKWLSLLDYREISGAGSGFAEYFINMSEEIDPVMVNGIKNVWCFSGIPMRQYCLVNVVMTVKSMRYAGLPEKQ